ncbi:MAG: VCBS repeat-containing protein [Myxococcota bacterium]
MRNHRLLEVTVAVTALVGCGDPDPGEDSASSAGAESGQATSGTMTSGPTPGSSTDVADSTAEGTRGDSTGGDDTPVLDVGGGLDLGGPSELCFVADDDITGIGGCDAPPLAESFQPNVEWSWSGDSGDLQVLTTPLVANLTDDDGDGEVTLCDIPDVVVLAAPAGTSEARLYVLDGATGALHWASGFTLDFLTNPALGDIDGDGQVEILAVRELDFGGPGEIIAFEHDGSVAWGSAVDGFRGLGHITLADLDADGDVEIMVDEVVATHLGAQIGSNEPGSGAGVTPVAADLDDDGDLEIIYGNYAYHHDGSTYFALPNDPDELHFAHVADIDGDSLPEVIISTRDDAGLRGLTVVEHDGTVKFEDAMPSLSGLPAAVHDIDGDGAADLVVGNGSYVTPNFGVLRYDPRTEGLASDWSLPVLGGCCASGTAFDFLGDGSAEAMFGDDDQLYVFDADGTALLTAPRSSPTGTDYPVVADVDNDQSAEIIVVSADPSGTAPAVQVIGDADSGWTAARRIWNQHAYFVTNVREDGTIPTVQPPHWSSLNTFRTQAQIQADGGVCTPAG